MDKGVSVEIAFARRELDVYNPLGQRALKLIIGKEEPLQEEALVPDSLVAEDYISILRNNNSY